MMKSLERKNLKILYYTLFMLPFFSFQKCVKNLQKDIFKKVQ